MKLSQTHRLVNVKAAIVTKRSGLTLNNLALVKIAALLGDAEDLQGAYELIEQASKIRKSTEVWKKENVELAKTMALSQREQRNAAMAAERNITHGGIDLNTSNGMQWEISKDGQGVEMNVDPAMLAQLQNAPGFVPVIINIQPLKSLLEFLGLNQP